MTIRTLSAAAAVWTAASTWAALASAQTPVEASDDAGSLPATDSAAAPVDSAAVDASGTQASAAPPPAADAAPTDAPAAAADASAADGSPATAAGEAVGSIPLAADGAAAVAPAPAARSSLGVSTVEEIVVTAEKREESLSNVPIAVSAFTGDDLKTLGITDTRNLANLVPGFTYGDSGYGVPVYSIRGIGFNDPSQSASSTVGIYNDEFNLPYPSFSKGSNLDVKRVEILKGPQGTLYGRNTTGGLVNYIANKPTDALEAGGSIGYARFGVMDGEGYVSGPLLDGVRARLALRETRSTQGWQTSNTRPGDTLGRQNKQAGRLTLDWKPVDELVTTLTLSGWLDHSEPQAPQAIAIHPQNATAGALALSPQVSSYPLIPIDTDDARVADWSPDLNFHLHERFGMAGLRTDWSLSDSMTLTFLGSYADFRINHSIIPQTGLNSNNTERELVDHTNSNTYELRLSGMFGDDIHYLLGGYLSHDRVDDFNRIYVDTNSAVYPLPLAGPVFAQLQPLLSLAGLTIPTVGDVFTNRVDAEGIQVADTRALFANTDWQFLPDFKLNLGVRYTAEKRDFYGCTRDDTTQSSGVGFSNAFDAVQILQATLHGAPPPTQLAQPGGCIEYDPQTFNAQPYYGTLKEPNVSFRSAFDWTPSNDSLYYVSYSRGFKSGSFPIVAASTNAQYKPAVEEKLDAYEVGAKTSFFEKRLRFNSAAFYYNYVNKQLYGVIYDQIFGPLPVLVNAPKSTVQGVEAELQSSPIDGLFLALNGAYIRTRLGDYTGLDTQGKPQDLTGKPFNYAPRVSLTLLANYTIAIGESQSLGFGGDYSYRSKTNSILTQDPLFAIESYRLLNLHMDYGAIEGSWNTSLYVRNVLNEFYSNGTINTGDTVARFTGMPRTYGITLSFRYR